VALLEGCEVDDLDDGQDESRRYKSLSSGPTPIVVDVDGIEAAAAKTIEYIKSFRADLTDGSSRTICAVAPSEKLRDVLSAKVEATGLPCVTMTAQANHSEEQDAVHFATMHRAKGLEFDAVVVVAPISYFGSPEESSVQRRLMYVAITRAKRFAALIRLA
jgi:superfamily I DNA/RNA helicase